MASSSRALVLISACTLLLLLLANTAFARDNPPGKAKCNNPKYKECHNLEHVCPKFCPGGYCEVDCRSCKPVCSCDTPGAVCQDPRFIGGDGITFYFHGKKDREFCLVTDSNLHINAHFIGKRNPEMKRDFTWVQSIGVLFDNHWIFVGALKTVTWDDAVDRLSLSVDGEPIFLQTKEGSKWESSIIPNASITRSRDTNKVIVEVEGNFRIEAKVVPITEEESRVHGYGVTDEDCMAHLELSFKFFSLSDDVNGVLGQTYANGYVSRAKMGVDMPVLGGEKEFAASSLFTPDCSVARFVGSSSLWESLYVDIASLRCASGMDHLGVVCKREISIHHSVSPL